MIERERRLHRAKVFPAGYAFAATPQWNKRRPCYATLTLPLARKGGRVFCPAPGCHER